jgi:hypothetical protein
MAPFLMVQIRGMRGKPFHFDLRVRTDVLFDHRLCTEKIDASILVSRAVCTYSNATKDPGVFEARVCNHNPSILQGI